MRKTWVATSQIVAAIVLTVGLIATGVQYVTAVAGDLQNQQNQLYQQQQSIFELSARLSSLIDEIHSLNENVTGLQASQAQIASQWQEFLTLQKELLSKDTPNP